MSIDHKYFNREYQFLTKAGADFADKHPELADALGFNEGRTKDPFVERLLEAFAFLAGRIHERLDEDLPEITGGLLEQLFPQFLKPFPSCAIIQAICPEGTTASKVIKRGSRVSTESRSFPDLNGEQAEFTYSTTRHATLQPIELRKVKIVNAGKDQSAIELQFQLDSAADFQSLNFEKLNIFLQGQDSLRFYLLELLTRHLREIQINFTPQQTGVFQTIPGAHIAIPGLFQNISIIDDEVFEGDNTFIITSEADSTINENASLLYARESFTGFRLLQEYFAVPDLFFLIDIYGLNRVKPVEDCSSFSMRLVFSEKYNLEYKPSVENIRLNCLPVINLFEQDIETVDIDLRLPEYRLATNRARLNSEEIYSVNHVSGIYRDTGEESTLLPVTAYDFSRAVAVTGVRNRFYSIIRKPVEKAMAETYIRLFDDHSSDDVFRKETLGIKATVSNGFMAARLGGKLPINRPKHGDFPEGTSIGNVTRPSPVLPPPDPTNYQWSLISHLSISYTTLADLENFKRLLSLYNWSREDNNRNKKRIESIVEILDPIRKTIMHDRGIIQGIEFSVIVDRKIYGDSDGDLFMFGSVLSRFLSQYATINSFVFLKIIERPDGKVYKWEPNRGLILTV